MGKYYEALCRDVRFAEGLNACMNCGMCTAVCPAAEFYDYDPRQIVDEVQSKDDARIEALLRSDKIWYCGECMSCKPRCPRSNTPAYIIQALRTLSQKTGLFTESEKGRQQLAVKRTVGQNILDLGYCIHPTRVDPGLHPEQGPVWEWVHGHVADVFGRFDDGYDREVPGAMKKMSRATLDEMRRIFEVTGGLEFFEDIERHSARKAAELGMAETVDGRERASDEYMRMTFTADNGQHNL